MHPVGECVITVYIQDQTRHLAVVSQDIVDEMRVVLANLVGERESADWIIVGGEPTRRERRLFRKLIRT